MDRGEGMGRKIRKENGVRGRIKKVGEEGKGKEK